MRLLITFAAGITLIAAPGMRAQNPQAATNLAKQATGAGPKPATSGQAAPAKSVPAKPATVGKPAGAKKSGTAAKPKATPGAKAVSEKTPVASEPKVARRDP